MQTISRLWLACTSVITNLDQIPKADDSVARPRIIPESLVVSTTPLRSAPIFFFLFLPVLFFCPCFLCLLFFLPLSLPSFSFFEFRTVTEVLELVELPHVKGFNYCGDFAWTVPSSNHLIAVFIGSFSVVLSHSFCAA